MKIHLIAVHYDSNKKISGFRLLDSDNGQVMDQPYQAVKNVIASRTAKIKGLSLAAGGKLKGNNGSLERYPALINNSVINNSIVIINSIDDIGYRICNYEGKMLEEKADKIIQFANNNVQIANGKLVTKDNKIFISAISGKYDNISLSETTLGKQIQKKKDDREYAKKLTKEFNESVNIERNKKEITDTNGEKHKISIGYHRNNDYRLPRVITGNPLNPSRMHEVDPDTGMTLEQKMAYTFLAVQTVRPFYYSILSLLKRVEADPSDGIDTMGVSIDTLYFNPELILKESLPDLLFIVLHEICHIAMKHRARANGREHDAWNVATDYYIDAMIAAEFGLKSLGDVVQANNKAFTTNYTKYKIGLPNWVLFNPNIDIHNDTPEKLYEELMRKNQEDKNQSQDQNQNDPNSDNTEQNQNSNNQNQDQDKEQNRDKNQNNSDDRQNQNSQDHENQDGNQQDKNSNKQNINQNKQNQNSSEQNSTNSEIQKNQQKQNDTNRTLNKTTDNRQNDENKQQNINNSPGRFVGKEFRGQEITEYKTDIFDDNKTNGATPEQISQMSSSLINQAVTVHKQRNTFGGDNADFLERYVEEAIAPKVSWKSVLRRFLTKAGQKEYTFAHPDRRFLNRINSDGSKQIFAGPHVNQSTELENIKICIDTSGSISAQDIGIALAQIEDMFKKYKATAELVYWDTRVRAVYPFKNYKELLSKEPKGGGGTDVNCVFDYFENTKEYKIKKKPKPSLIIIFTDGYFGEVDKSYKKKYKNTIWIVHDNPRFEEPFGIKAPLKLEN